MNTLALMLASAVLGLVAGSFINVLIHRLPIMLAREYGGEDRHSGGRFDLAWPPSHCPRCLARLSWRENIPLFSWLFQRGRCRHCNQPIAWRYPVVELAAAGLSVLALWLPWPGAWAYPWHLLLLWGLLALAVIDLEQRLLPDVLTLSLLWLGLLVNLDGGLTPLPDAVIGATAGYLCLWGLRALHMQLRGVEGLGLGDAKMLAALGAWLGWALLPLVLLIASLLGTLVGLALIASRRGDWQVQLPFGQWLALAGGLALCFGEAWLRWLA